ncbi:MAG: amidohydrolase family protein, partial [Deltaproteobacteria bacterium]|nr:amidohydrolase family protein [Deltaproteobacteria bacterium]
DGARALKWFDEIGSIETGKKADLVALDLNCPENTLPAPAALARRPDLDAIASSIVYSSQASHVRWTMVEGRLLYRDGKVRTIDTASLMKRVHRAQLAIAKRIKRRA